MTRPSTESAYALARQAYADVGVDVEAALVRLDRVALALEVGHGDPAGRAGAADALRAEAEVALAQQPGPTRLTLHAGALEADRPLAPGAIRPEHFQRWVDWAKQRGIGLDLGSSPTAPADLRAFVEQGRALRDASAHLGRSLGTPSLTVLRVREDLAEPANHVFTARRRLAEALEEILAVPFAREHQRDAVGPGELALACAARHGITLALDAGPARPAELISSELATALPFVEGVRLSVSGDVTVAIARDFVRAGALDRVALAVAGRSLTAWVQGARAVRQGLLRALLDPPEIAGDGQLDPAPRLIRLEAQATLPWQAVWAHYCESRGAPPDAGWIGAVLAHEGRGSTAAPAAVAHQVAAAAPSAAERLFHSPEVNSQKARICDMGRRLWQRAYVDGNGGNLSVRVSGDLVLCTPTLVSKGFMAPEDLCLVDMDGVQRAGAKRATSEILMHLAIYRAQPLARACVHAHPPHATGFAVSYVQPTSCLVPEMEVFCGEVPVAPYFTPGTPAVGESVARLCDRHNTVLMGNHGAVAWGFDVQDAYFKMEILESYCRTLLVTAQLGGPTRFTPEELRALLAIKERLGIPDARLTAEAAQPPKR
jgi:L-fuculose-phosphate aldolase